MEREETENIDDNPRRIMLDDTAISTDPEMPAFIAKPDGAPAYYGFPLVPESVTDGWCLGTITGYEDPDGCDFGDAFVIAPDGSRAGLLWSVGEGDVERICQPDEMRWGVYQIWFQRPVRTTDDLIIGFRKVLPQLRKIHEQFTNRQP